MHVCDILRAKEAAPSFRSPQVRKPEMKAPPKRNMGTILSCKDRRMSSPKKLTEMIMMVNISAVRLLSSCYVWMCALIYDHIADYNAAANNFAQMQLDDDEFMREPPQQSLAFKVLLLPTTTTTTTTTTISYYYYHYYNFLLQPPPPPPPPPLLLLPP